MRSLLLLVLTLLTVVTARADKLVLAGEALSLEQPAWLQPVTKEQYAKLSPKKRYPQNYHETKDRKLSLYSELDRDSGGKSLADLNKEAVAMQNEMFEGTITWNRKELTTIGGKEFSVLDYNVKDPEGDKEFTFRMIVLDSIVNGKVTHTVIQIADKEAEKAYVEKLYAWLGVK